MQRAEVAAMLLAIMGLAALHPAPGIAGEADVLEVYVVREAPDTFRFSATVQHADEGWDHYADRWEVVAPDGTILGERILAHPHVGEQPFTRSLGGVVIPEGISEVTIRANDSVHGLGGTEVTVGLPGR